MTDLGLDFETFSRLDIKKVGTSRYTRHKSTRPLLLGYAFDDEPVDVVRIDEGEPLPKRLEEALEDPEVLKWAWNAPFEIGILKHQMGVKVRLREWRDTMVHALALSYPGKLEKAGKAIGLPEDKQKDRRGKALIKRFSVPNKPTKKRPWAISDCLTDPQDWEDFVTYCGGDVEVEREIRKYLSRWPMSDEEWELWTIDQLINHQGIPISMPVVHNAIEVARDVVEERLAEMRRITGLDNPNSNVQLLPWLQSAGYRFEDLKKGHVERVYQEEVSSGRAEEDLGRVLEMRLEVSKSSVKKYNALRDATDDDGFLRHTLQFNGAPRTGRWGGRKYQPQNLARPVKALENCLEEAVQHLEVFDKDILEMLYKKPMDVLSSCVRPVVQAPEGYSLLDADLNAIENRVLGWLADDEKIMDVFREGRDPYIDFAKYMFKQPYEKLWAEYKAGNKDKRTLAKPGVLGCGYMLGAGEEKENKKTGEMEATGLLGYARNMRVDMTPEQSAKAVKVFRETFRDVVNFWYALDKAARRCIKTRRPQRVGLLRFDISGPFMRIRLPSGRHLHYKSPRIESRRTPWGDMRPTITYEGVTDKGHWGRIPTHPGKITENIVQAVARDVLGHGIVLAKRKRLDVRLHVHDQIVALIETELAEQGLKVLNACMSKVPKWAPGLLLASEGNISRVFMKD